MQQSQDGFTATRSGKGDIPVPADFDGDGRADIAVFRPSTAIWYILNSSGGVSIQQFGASSDIPAVGGYDGDKKADLAVWRESNKNWYILRSGLGVLIQQFGSEGDKPVPSAFIP